MARRKKKHAEHENHERWLVSYADFITLLFAFFVVMFASSHADKGRAAKVSDSVKEALEQGALPALVASVLGGTVGDTGQGNAQMKGPGGAQIARHDGEREGLEESERPARPGDRAGGMIAELRPAFEYLAGELQEEIERGLMTVSLEPRGLVIGFREAAFFPTGEATISPDRMDAIAKVAAVIRRLPNPVRMEGHTDSVPIHNEKYASNWELSAARAIAMLKLFADRFGVPKERMSIAAYADNAPVASNETEEGRARNRRVDIILLSRIGAQAEPANETTRVVVEGAE